MDLICRKEDCTGCGACVYVCPQKCIKLVDDEQGFLHPKIDEKKCINCNRCVTLCPINVQENQSNSIKKAIVAYAKDDGIRKSASSGGIFALVANYILEKNGVVVGAAMTSNYKSVNHVAIFEKDKLGVICGSKYVQSQMRDIYLLMKQQLEFGKLVLFVGTPCQVAGVKRFFGEKYENLFLIDLVCHGVASPNVWRDYVEWIQQKKDAKIVELNFRNKCTGWKNYSITMRMENGKNYCKEARKDLYLRGYGANLYLRESCYNCHFKSLSRQGDITLADCWGIDKIMPEMFDNKGISLVLTNTEKGDVLIRGIESGINKSDIDIEKAVKYNMSTIKSAKKPERYSQFWMLYREKGVYSALKKCAYVTMKERIKFGIKKMLKR